MNKDNEQLDSTSLENTIEIVSLAINAIPLVGGTISGVANMYVKSRQNKRLNEFIIQLSTDLKCLENRINSNIANTEEFKYFVEDIFSTVEQCKQKEKINAFRCLFLNFSISAKPRYDEALEILDLVKRWQDRHIIILKILNDADEKTNENITYSFSNGSNGSIDITLKNLLPEWDAGQIERTWNDLYDSKIHSTPNITFLCSDSGIKLLQNRLTIFGKKVSDYLKEPIV